MADNYTQFSFKIEKLTPKEGVWLKNLLALEFEGDQEEITGAISDTSIEYWPEFCFSLDDRALWLYTDDSGNPYNAALLVRAFLAKFRPNDIMQFSVAYTCSKPRQDEFGGETYVVTSQNIYSDAGVAGMLVNAIKTGQQQKMGFSGLDIIVRPKKPRRAGG